MPIDRISGNGGPVEIPSARSNRGDGSKSQPVRRDQDRVSLSGRRSEFGRIRALVDASPNVRSSRVEELARIIDRNEYHVDSQDVADAIIQQNWSDSRP
jgi:flagellar biosynthesis anti-sigma factor FlgM